MKTGRTKIVDYSGQPPGAVTMITDQSASGWIAGWRDPDDVMLVGDFRRLGHDQVMFINRGPGGLAMIVDFISQPNVLHVEEGAGSGWLRGWTGLESKAIVGDFHGLGYDQVMFINGSAPGERISIIDWSQKPRELWVTTANDSRWLDGWLSPDDVMLVGDFRRLGHDQVMFINRGPGGLVMIVDFISQPNVLHVEEGAGSGWLRGWTGLESKAIVGDFHGLGYDQVMFINGSAPGERISIIDWSQKPRELWVTTANDSRWLDGWLSPDDVMLVGDFRRLGHDQVMFINRGPGGRVMIAHFSVTSAEIAYWEDAGQSDVFSNWTDRDSALAGDFRGDKYSQALFVHRSSIVGFADLHNHQFAEWAFGGKLFHGRAYGDPKSALRWCDVVHGPGGVKDFLVNILGTVQGVGSPFGHLVGGWPEFDGWPRWNSISHQTVHQDWLKRAVNGGLRLLVMLAVNNEYVAKQVDRRKGRTSSDMEAVDLQLQDARKMEEYVDSQHGGPGKGWYRIVTHPSEAISVMAQGKLAVVLGIEVDYLFNARKVGNVSEAQMIDGLNKYYAMGVRHLFPIHFDDNGFGGASFDKPLQNGNLDRLRGRPIASPYSLITEDGRNLGYTAKGGQVNAHGLTDLGRALIREAMDRGMIIEVDHMSRKSRSETFAIAEQRGYPLCSGHTGFVEISRGEKRHEGNLTADEVERLRALGGIVSVILSQGGLAEITSYTRSGTSVEHSAGHTSNTLLQAYLYAVDKMRGGPVAIGTDFNGFAGVPRGRVPKDAIAALKDGYQLKAGRKWHTNPVRYPIANPLTGGAMRKQVTGERVWDINEDGPVHIGMLPDLIADFRAQGLNDADLGPLMNSADGYVRMWERALASK